MKYGIIVFPGSNCERDCFEAVTELGAEAVYVWHEEDNVEGLDCLILPGGFSYGDHLRTGAIARFSPVMKAVKRFAADGGLVIGICNGFQILLEAHLLPGAMLPNNSIKFICKDVHLKVEDNGTVFTSKAEPGQVLKLPIAHYEGNYFSGTADLDNLHEDGRILLSYSDSEGRVTQEANPNGSQNNAAGIANAAGNVFGLMPHPERAVDSLLRSTDGRIIFNSVMDHCAKRGSLDSSAGA